MVRISLLRELWLVLRAVADFVRGFRTPHVVGPCVTAFAPARNGEEHPYSAKRGQPGRAVWNFGGGSGFFPKPMPLMRRFAVDSASAGLAARSDMVQGPARRSLHVEPRGTVAIIRHYLRDLVYGANDGIITTFAVVAGVAGGQLSPAAVLIVGAANLAADGVSMGAGNLLAIRAHESARAAEGLPEEEARPLRHGVATLVAFVFAGAVPLTPYVLPLPPDLRFTWSVAMTMGALFVVGAARSAVTLDRWWQAGLEMLGLGALVAAAAYAAGAVIARVLA